MTEKYRREALTYVELVRMCSTLVPDFEHLVGEKAEATRHLGTNEFIQVLGTRMEMPDLTIDWIGVGKAKRDHEWHKTWGKAPSETLPCLRFNRAADHLSEFFDEGEPYKYRILFRETSEGLKIVVVERMVEEEEGEGWQACDETTTYLVVKTMHELLPRLNQHGE